MAKASSGIRLLKFTICGKTGLCWGKRSAEVRRDEETPDQFDDRAVLTRVRLDNEGHPAISSEGIKRAILIAGTRLNMKVPGGAGGKATFKARLQAGILLTGDSFPVFRNGKRITLQDLTIEMLDVPSDGKKGGTSRVFRRFPKLLGSWEAQCEFIITDEALTEDVLFRHIRAAGLYDGIGTYRVGTGYSHGLFELYSNGKPALSLEPVTI